MVISISGAGGSGKSTVAKRLAETLNYSHYYMGGLRREAAAKKGLTLAEYNLLGETDIGTDQEVDQYQKQLGQKEADFVIEGRTSWYFIPHSLKIYLNVSEEEGAKRVFSHLQQENKRNEDKALNSIEDVRISIARRLKSDNLRYKQYYDINVNDQSNYDLCLDTTNLDPEETFRRVYEFVLSRLDKS